MPSPRHMVRRLAIRARNSDRAWIRTAFLNARHFYRWAGRTFRFLHLGWVAPLREVRWDGDRLVVAGWAYTRGTGYQTPPRIEVQLSRRGSRARISASVEPRTDVDANARARAAEFDYSNTAFRATFDLTELATAAPRSRRSWKVTIRVIGGGRRFWGPFRSVHRFGSPVVMPARQIAPGIQIAPRWKRRRGLMIDHLRLDQVARSASVDGTRLRIELGAGESLKAPRLLGEGQESVTLVPNGPGVLAGPVPPVTEVVDEVTGRTLTPRWQLVAASGQPVYVSSEFSTGDSADGVRFRAAPDGTLELVQVPEFVEIDSAELVREPELGVRFTGTSTCDWESSALFFDGPLHSLPVEINDIGEGRFEGFVKLTLSVWGGPALPVAAGGYALAVRTAQGEARTFVSRDFAENGLEHFSLPELRLRFELNRTDQFRFGVSRPRREEELGSYFQTQLFRTYGERDYEPRDAVYFESFFGKNATCNPRAIDREIARRFPQMPRYWAVSDRSIAVPEGAIAVVTGSKEWWDARGSSRYVITNEWLKTRFIKRSYQRVLQTWHGSMYKKIGLDRTGMSRRHLNLVRAERANWDYFISQNAPGTEIIAHAYDFAPEDILEIGYPRNDELQDVSDSRIAEIRGRLGIGEGKKLIMYAPTWREQQSGVVDFLDLEQLSASLGDDYVVMLRGHIRTLERSHSGDGVLDVSTYPHVSELFLVADAMITDYSSMMFDYSVTGKPMIFFTPDIDDYRNTKVRGVYFDLAELAPGPVVRTQVEVEAALRDLDEVRAQNADKYVAWQKMFNHHDDGKASQRAVDILFGDRPAH